MLFEENPIDGHFAEYGHRSGEIRLAGQSFHKPVLVHKDSVCLSQCRTLSDLTPDNLLSDVKADDYPEILIIGTGAVQKFIHPKIMADFSQIGIGVECMNTESACRTLAFLHSEGRKAWAWLRP
ncbi:TPA: Mth938-like domain-containing protein [Neisseria polysaccharea]|uniref:Mth938-like domain-containing protein n=1 Tax=Neisseria polysaccharea TaxID=489 RepID=UPI0027DF6AC9|nr:Mth938-like domain-containing protein [Neisseria polysaccharea]